VITNIEVSAKIPFQDIPGFSAALKDVEAKLKGRGRHLIRYSGTENIARVMLEGENQQQIQGFADELAHIIEGHMSKKKDDKQKAPRIGLDFSA